MVRIGRMIIGSLFLVTLFGVTAAGPASAVTAVPEVTGPLPVSASSYPFGAADHQLVPQDLARDGYVEEEFLVSGSANVYSWPAPGPAVVRTPAAPYTTRVLVRRPARATHFSGNVVVEMLNPSNLFDLNIGWAMMHRQLIGNGDAWVGSRSSRCRWSPSRPSTRCATGICRWPTRCRSTTRAIAQRPSP